MISSELENLEREIATQGAFVERLLTEVGKRIVGQRAMIERILIAMLADGHILLEGLPGLAKTLAVKTFAEAIAAQFARIQFTPDLLPADLIGTMIYRKETGEFVPKLGPLFANLILADEINRAPAKVQSALLEAMEERQVTLGDASHKLPAPFLVFATQNPIEQEGTYPLPEAQLDRFLMKIIVTYPNREELATIVDRTIAREEVEIHPVLDKQQILSVRDVCRQVMVAPHVRDFAIQIVMATQPDQKDAHEAAKKYIRYGSSPRGAQALVECGRVLALMRGRYHLAVDDIQTVAAAVLRHRIILNFDAHADGETPDTVLNAILSSVTEQASVA